MTMILFHHSTRDRGKQKEYHETCTHDYWHHGKKPQQAQRNENRLTAG
jgi:hypothetical protein